MSANFAGVPALLGNMQYTAGNISGVNAGIQYRDAMRMKRLQSAMELAAQQQQQMNADRARRDSLRQYSDQQARANRQEQYGMQRDAMADQWKERLYKESLGDKAYARERDTVGDTRYADATAYARGRDTVQDTRYADEMQRALENQAYGRSRDTLADTRYDTGQQLALENQNYQRGRDTVQDQRYADTRAYAMGRDTLMDKRYQENQNFVMGDRWADNARQWTSTLLNNPFTQAAASWLRQPRDARAQRPMSVSDAKALAEMEAQARAGGEGSDVARATLQNLGRPAPLDMTPIESRKSGWLNRAWNAFSSANPAGSIPYLAEGHSENWRQAYTGYSTEDATKELQEIDARLQQVLDRYDAKGNIRPGMELTKDEERYLEELQRRKQAIEDGLSATL